MKVFVVNLDRARERMAFIDAQLQRLGVEYERISAVDGKEMSPDDLRNAVSGFRWWCAIGRPVRAGEIGCALSHYGIYSKISSPVCILEDDVEIKPGFVAALAEIERFIDDSRPEVVLLSDLWGRRSAKGGAHGIVSSVDGSCTDGYVITTAAAKVLLRANLPMSTPCDSWGRWSQRGIIELYHYLPSVVVQRGDLYGSATNPSGLNGRGAPLARKVLHKLKRLVGVSLDYILWVTRL